MGKKSSQSPMKISKHEKKQQLNSLIKILRPKVYITDSSNFKKLVQELTGNGKYSPVLSSPPPSKSVTLSPPTDEDHEYHYAFDQENSPNFFSSVDSSCFSSPLEGWPGLSPPGSLNYLSENPLSTGSQKMDLYSQYKDLEWMLMEMDSGSCNYTDGCYNGMFQPEVCVYDYDLSTLI